MAACSMAMGPGAAGPTKSSRRPLACWQRRAMMSAASSTVHACRIAWRAGQAGSCRLPRWLPIGEHAQVAEVGVAHPVRVVLEVAQFLVQLAGRDAVGAPVSGGRDRRDVARVQFVEPVSSLPY